MPTGSVYVLSIDTTEGNVTFKVSHLVVAPALSGEGMGTSMCMVCPESAALSCSWSPWLVTLKDVAPYEHK